MTIDTMPYIGGYWGWRVSSAVLFQQIDAGLALAAHGLIPIKRMLAQGRLATLMLAFLP